MFLLPLLLHFSIFTDLLHQLDQRLHLLRRDEIKFRYEVVKVFEACIYMWFSAYTNDPMEKRREINFRDCHRDSNQKHSPIKMMNINVYKNAEESGENFLAERHECFGKGYVGGHWKYPFVVNLSLHPVHEALDVFACG
jgi:hypothetical protein